MRVGSPQNRKPSIKVLLITPYQIIQKCFKVLIEDNSDISVIKSVCLMEEILDHSDLEVPDIGLIYLMDGDVQTVEIISTLTEKFPEIKIVIVTAKDDFPNQTRALQLGAVGIVQKEQNARILIEAIRQTSKGETWISQVLLAKLLKEKDPKKSSSKSWDVLKAQTLTSREKQVVMLIGKGMKNRDIADSLKISEATVRHHLSSIYGKAGVEDRLNLVIYAYQHGLINLSQESEPI